MVSRSQLKVSRCLQIKPSGPSADRADPNCSGQGEELLWLCLFACTIQTCLCADECSCPHSGLLANPMRGRCGFLWRQKSIVFLFYLLVSYISISREEGHTEIRGKDTRPGNTADCYSGAGLKNNNKAQKVKLKYAERQHNKDFLWKYFVTLLYFIMYLLHNCQNQFSNQWHSRLRPIAWEVISQLLRHKRRTQ